MPILIYRATVDLLTARLAEPELDYGDEEPPPDVREIMNIVLPRLSRGDAE